MQWRLVSLGPEEEPNPRGHVAPAVARGAEGALADGPPSDEASARAPKPIGHVAAAGLDGVSVLIPPFSSPGFSVTEASLLADSETRSSLPETCFEP